MFSESPDKSALRIAVTSQNFRTVTGHAGKTRRFLVYRAGPDGTVTELDRLDLPMGMALHDYHGDDHPVYAFDAVVTAGCGDGFARRLAERGVRVVATAETDPLVAVAAVAAGRALPPALPHEH